MIENPLDNFPLPDVLKKRISRRQLLADTLKVGSGLLIGAGLGAAGQEIYSDKVAKSSGGVERSQSLKLSQNTLAETTISPEEIIADLESQYNIHIGVAGETYWPADEDSQQTLKNVGLSEIQAVLPNGEILKVINDVCVEMPYIGNIVNRVIFSENKVDLPSTVFSYPSQDSRVRASKVEKNYFEGLYDGTFTISDVYVFLPSNLVRELGKSISLDDKYPYPEYYSLHGGEIGKSPTYREVIRQVIFHEIGHGIEKKGIALSVDDKDFQKYENIHSRLRAEKNPIMEGFRTARKASFVDPENRRVVSDLQVRKHITYTPEDDNTVLVSDNDRTWTIKTPLEGYIDRRVSNFRDVDPAEWRSYSPRTIFGSPTEAFADWYMFFKLGYQLPEDIYEFIQRIDNSYLVGAEEVLYKDLLEDQGRAVVK